MHNHSTCKEFVSFLHVRLSMNAFFALLISFLGALFTAAILRAVTNNIDKQRLRLGAQCHKHTPAKPKTQQNGQDSDLTSTHDV